MKTETSTNSINIVNRFEEINLFEDYFLKLRNKSNTAKSIIDFWGIPGIGKSTLMHEIMEKSLANKHEIVFIDFKDVFLGANRISYTKSCEMIFTELNKKILSSPHRQATNLFSLQVTEKSINDLTLDFVNSTKKYLFLHEKRFLIFLFDSTEYCRPDVFHWLEKTIFSPLTSTKKVFIVLASQSQNKWRTFDVKQQLIEWHIQPFNTNSVRKQIGYDGNSANELASRIFELSFGIPACNALVYKAVENVYEKKGIMAAFSDTKKAKYVHDEVQFFYRHTVRKLTPELKYVLRIVSQLKWFDYALLREILVSTRPESYTSGKASKYRDITRQLEETKYISWDIQNRGFAMDFTMRKILSLDLKLNHKTLFIQVQKIVLQWFKRLTDQYNSSYLFFLDLIYYRALFNELEPASLEINKGINEIASSNINPLEKMSLLEQIIRLANEAEYKDVVPSMYVELIRKSSLYELEKLLNTES
mgnify:FL=1